MQTLLILAVTCSYMGFEQEYYWWPLKNFLSEVYVKVLTYQLYFVCDRIGLHVDGAKSRLDCTSLLLYMGLHTANAVANKSGALWQGCLALLLISADMLFLFYARPYVEDWKDFVICFVELQTL